MSRDAHRVSSPWCHWASSLVRQGLSFGTAGLQLRFFDNFLCGGAHLPPWEHWESCVLLQALSCVARAQESSCPWGHHRHLQHS